MRRMGLNGTGYAGLNGELIFIYFRMLTLGGQFLVILQVV